MTTEEMQSKKDAELRRRGDAFSGGIFLISLGVLLFTGWWWPGIMVAIGLSSGAGLIFRGKIWEGIGSLVFFCGIAVAVEIVRATDIDWTLMAAFILIGVGVITLIKAFVLRE